MKNLIFILLLSVFSTSSFAQGYFGGSEDLTAQDVYERLKERNTQIRLDEAVEESLQDLHVGLIQDSRLQNETFSFDRKNIKFLNAEKDIFEIHGLSENYACKVFLLTYPDKTEFSAACEHQKSAEQIKLEKAIQ